MCKPRSGPAPSPTRPVYGSNLFIFPQRMFIRFEKTLNKVNLKIGIHFANKR